MITGKKPGTQTKSISFLGTKLRGGYQGNSLFGGGRKYLLPPSFWEKKKKREIVKNINYKIIKSIVILFQVKAKLKRLFFK